MQETQRTDQLPLIVAKQIKEMIVSQHFKPGDRLPSEMELASLANVSRSTVREAMKYLKAENVIVIKQGQGTFVSALPGVGKDPFGIEFLDQSNLLENLFEARLLFEPQIAMLAAQRCTQENVEVLKTIVDQMQELDKNDDRAMALDLQFHRAVAECTQNEVLTRVVPTINDSIVYSRSKTVGVHGTQERAKKAHAGIYEAIKNHDLMAAKYIAEKHVWETLNDVKKKMEDNNEKENS